MTKALKPITVTAPSYWAPLLINGDKGDLTEAEIKRAYDWIEGICCGMPVSCEDADFIRYHDAHPFSPYAADCQTYTFLIEA